GTGALVRTVQGHSVPVYSVAFLPDGARVLAGSRDNTIKLWDVATGALLRTFQGYSNRVYSVAFSPDGARVTSSIQSCAAQSLMGSTTSMPTRLPLPSTPRRWWSTMGKKRHRKAK